MKMSAKGLQSLSIAAVLGLLVGPATVAAAQVPVLQHTVGPQDNLYHDAWGHPWTEQMVLITDPVTGDLRARDDILDWPAPFALGAGVPARSVQHQGSAFDFSVPDWDFVDVVATGLIQDRNLDQTGPDGDGSDTFRGLDVYSLIGIWSSSPDAIVPIGDWQPNATPAFDIGSSARLSIPQGFAVYLFLAENDGLFYDNLGSYSVVLTGGLLPNGTVVPLPGAVALLLPALAALPRRRRNPA
jgi:hypothetical protein